VGLDPDARRRSRGRRGVRDAFSISRLPDSRFEHDAGSAVGSKTRRSRIAGIVAFGGQSARAGYAFASRMMLRDWQFRRTLIGMSVVALMSVPAMVVSGWKIDPFSNQFTAMYFLPHTFGFLLFLICLVLPYGSDYKGAWVFRLSAGIRETFVFIELP
jgi:hypothetical protein